MAELKKEDAKLFGIEGVVVSDIKGQVSVSITISETDKIRRGYVALHVVTDSGNIISNWDVVPDVPLKVNFTLPANLAKNAVLFFSVSLKSEPELEMITMTYTIDLEKNCIFEANTTDKHHKK